ncbi:RNA polymerase sigma factor [Paenibacillus thailandensis]|uniref:RNA polymerase sigma factor n=1 Tax=Paenibacillus thailandensis TaxID=393250 RepID=A0ABW5QU43_9BACL
MNGPNEEMEMELTLREMCDGSVEAFDRFYSRYAPLVFQIARRVVGDRMEAEDVCHDVFLEVIKRGGTYDSSRGSIEAWLAVMTRSRSLDRLRKERRLTSSEEADERRLGAAGADIEEAVVLRLQQEAVQEALQALPARQKEAIAYSYFGARTQRELSEAWNVPLGTVKSWVRYGLDNIRKQLEKRGWTVSERQSDRGEKR